MEFRMGFLTVIATYTHRTGSPPSLRTLAEITHLSRTAVHYHVKKLEEEGYIVRTDDHRRLIFLVGSGTGVV